MPQLLWNVFRQAMPVGLKPVALPECGRAVVKNMKVSVWHLSNVESAGEPAVAAT